MPFFLIWRRYWARLARWTSESREGSSRRWTKSSTTPRIASTRSVASSECRRSRSAGPTPGPKES